MPDKFHHPVRCQHSRLSGLVALPPSLVKGLLLEGDLTRFLEGLLADLLLCGGELSDMV